MKKTYNIPEMKVVQMQASSQMLAGSVGYGSSTTETSGNLSREADFDEEYQLAFYLTQRLIHAF